jgi:cysteine desulfurase
MKTPIFMDHHSTTPVDPRVLTAMMPFFTEQFGNAASNHSFGHEAEKAVAQAREQIAHLIHCDSKEIIITSGATESNNIALKGIAEAYGDKGNHIITAVTEHKAILDTARRLEKQGLKVTCLPVHSNGLVDPGAVLAAITDQTILISIMIANNEIGAIHPVAQIGQIAKEKGILFHTDAAQAAGKIPIDVNAMGIDLMSLSAHKMYGPKGVGALYVRRKSPRVRVMPLIDGGGQERGVRSGTLNVPGVVGFGKACEIAEREMEQEGARLARLRDRLQEIIWSGLDGVYLNGHPTARLPHNLNVSFACVEGESLLMGMHEVALSSGSACTTATPEPSYVLRALGVGSDLAHSSIRFGLGRFNTEEEVDYVGRRIVETVRRLRAMSPLYEMQGRN